MSSNTPKNGNFLSMINRIWLKRFGVVVLALTTSGGAFATQEKSVVRQRYVPGEILVKFKDGTVAKQKSQIRRQNSGQNQEAMFKAQLLKELDGSGLERWKLDGAQSVEQVQQELKKTAEIEYAEPNFYMYPMAIPNDFYYTRQWGLNNSSQTLNGVSGTVGADMEMQDAWDLQTGSDDVNVAVIDDGVQLDHPDLVGNIGLDRDVLDSDDDATPHDAESTHGTRVAGIIGAVGGTLGTGNNGVGITGVAWDVNMMPVLFADKDGGTVAGAVSAFNWASEKNAHIINYSYGAMSYSQSLADAVTALETAGILLVVPAGNGDVNNEFVPLYPSNLDNDNILSVAASNQDDEVAYWSQYGFATVDVMAPGENICTTTISDGYTCTDGNYIGGTSFAAPYVAGVAALVKSEFPAADFHDLKGRIMAGVEAKTTARDKVATGGRVNAENALIVAETEVLVIKSVTVDDGGNGVLDPSETTDLVIEIENAWKDSANVSATLSTTDGAFITINDANAIIGNIAEGESASATFNISFINAAVYRKIPFQLDITADGYSVTRYFNLVTGRLSSNTTKSATIQTDEYDDVHYYHFTLSGKGSGNLVVETTSDEDIDVFVMRGQRPPLAYLTTDQGTIYEYDTTASFGSGSTTSGNETATIADPSSGDYFIAVYSFAGVTNTDYTVQWYLTPSSSGGGSVPLLSLLMLGGVALVYRRK